LDKDAGSLYRQVIQLLRIRELNKIN